MPKRIHASPRAPRRAVNYYTSPDGHFARVAAFHALLHSLLGAHPFAEELRARRT
jgi:hypothetical protein